MGTRHGPEDPLFTPPPVVHKGPISSNSQFTSPLLRKNGKFTSIFAQIFALKPPILEIFSSQAPKFGNFQFTSPPLRKSGPHTHTWKKKLSAPPPRVRNLGSMRTSSSKFQGLDVVLQGRIARAPQPEAQPPLSPRNEMTHCTGVYGEPLFWVTVSPPGRHIILKSLATSLLS